LSFEGEVNYNFKTAGIYGLNFMTDKGVYLFLYGGIKC